MNDIDNMDLYYYLDVLCYKANKDHVKNVENILNIL